MGWINDILSIITDISYNISLDILKKPMSVKTADGIVTGCLSSGHLENYKVTL